MKRIFGTVILFLLIFLSTETQAIAKQENIVTPVFLVRDKSEWIDSSVSYLDQMIKAVEIRELPSTWLLDYNALKNLDTSSLASKAANSPFVWEVGLLMEVTEDLANDALVKYVATHNRYLPGSVFLTGYTATEKKKLIDTFIEKYLDIAGEYPKTVGAWYIDSWSINYLRDKYQIEAVLLVAEQYKTDHHTIRGHWWQSVYYPSQNHSLVPSFDDNKLDVVVFQWAAREPLLGYGFKEKYSNFSVQANDYTQQGLNQDYFISLLNRYIDNNYNAFNQLTLGIEVGQEGGEYYQEFLDQLDVIVQEKDKFQLMTVKEMSKIYKQSYPNGEKIRLVESENDSSWAVWISAQKYRIGLIYKDSNLIIRDLRIYNDTQEDLSWMADKNIELYRQTTPVIDQVGRGNQVVLLSNVNRPKILKNNDEYILAGDNYQINFGPVSFSLDPRMPLLESSYLMKTDSDTGVSYSLDNVEQVNIVSVNSMIFTIVSFIAFLFFVIKKKYRQLLIAILIFGFWFELWSLTPVNGLGFKYLLRASNFTQFIYLWWIYLIMPILLFLLIDVLSKKIWLRNKLSGFLLILLSFFPPSFGWLLSWYRNQQINPLQVMGLKTTFSPLLFNFRFSMIDKMAWAYSASGMNIDLISNLFQGTLIEQVIGFFIGFGFYLLITLGLLNLGVVIGLINTIKNKKYVYCWVIVFFIGMTAITLNNIHPGIPTVWEIGLRLIAIWYGTNWLSEKNNWQWSRFILLILLGISTSYLYIFIDQQNKFINLWSSKWKERQEVVQELNKFNNTTDYFSPNKSDSRVFIPMGMEDKYFINYSEIKNNKKIILENSYGLIVE